MTSKRAKFIVATVVLLGAFGYLALAGMQKGWVYFLDVQQYVSDPQYAHQRVRLHGKVGADAFEARVGGTVAKFQLTRGAAALPVIYHGQIPDLFAIDRDVVIEGKRDASGVFQADVLMTKCASKYETGSPHAGTAENAEKQS
jgi:cytochrome c-type biogenesis protein CcmE